MIPILFILSIFDAAAAAHFAGRWEAVVFVALGWATGVLAIFKAKEVIE
jgi:hypothetical protein